MSNPGIPRFVDAATLRRLVSMRDAIDSSARAFAALAAGELDSPRRSRLARQRALLMSAEHASGSAVVKLISLETDGFSTGRPSMSGVVAWLDAERGATSTLIDAAALTSLRTAAASGLATSLLAHEESSVLAMLGAGDLAADQIAAVCEVRPISEVRVWSRHRARAERLCALIEERRVAPSLHAARPASSAGKAVQGADVVCTATRATAPLFETGDLAPGAHVNAVGAYRHDMCELPPGAFAAAALVAVDDVGAALDEAGDLVAAIEAGLISTDRLVTVAELIAGKAVPPRGGTTVFKSVGVAAQDWAIAEVIARRA